jgi:hypothetical protein
VTLLDRFSSINGTHANTLGLAASSIRIPLGVAGACKRKESRLAVPRPLEEDENGTNTVTPIDNSKSVVASEKVDGKLIDEPHRRLLRRPCQN